MALSDPRIIYGVHSVTPYRRSNLLPYGQLRVLGGSTLSLNGELVKLNGGSLRFPWAIEDGNIETSMALKTKEFPDFLFEILLGKAPTAAGSGAGSSSGFENVEGTSVVASTGIATVDVSTASDLKFGRYVVKAVSATTVDVYCMSNVDFNRGTDAEFEDDELKITASPLTITTGSPVTVPGFGFDLTGGAGTIGMTADDTATFEILPPSDKSMSVRIGGASDVFPTFGVIAITQQRGTGEMFEMDLFNCKGIGMPLGAEEKAFGESDITIEAFYDAAKNGIMDIDTVVPA